MSIFMRVSHFSSLGRLLLKGSIWMPVMDRITLLYSDRITFLYPYLPFLWLGYSARGYDGQGEQEEQGAQQLQIYRRKSKVINKDPHVFSHNISSTPGHSTSPLVNDMDLPIALRKGARSCVRYPIANYVSYNVFFFLLPCLMFPILTMSQKLCLNLSRKRPWKKRCGLWRKTTLKTLRIFSEPKNLLRANGFSQSSSTKLD